MDIINYVSACAGSGKTTAALQAIKNGIERAGFRFVLAQPTKLLVHSTLERARALHPHINWRAITSDEHPGKARSEFIAAISSREEMAIITTHATLLSCWHIAGKHRWNLIVDEIPAIDATFRANLSITWDWWTSLIEVSDNVLCDNVLDVHVKAGQHALVETYAHNEPGDDVIKVTQPLWELIANAHWSVAMTRSSWQRAGYKGTAQMIAHAWLKPTIFDGWNRVTIMGANFENSLMMLVWSKQGVGFVPDDLIHIAAPTHTKETGRRCRVLYITERKWSKTLRDKIGIPRITGALQSSAFGNHIWTANKDVDERDWKLEHGTRLPAVAHGLNDFRDYTCAVFLAALNDCPAHFTWMQKQWGIDPRELSKAKAQEVAYQMIMRTNLREADGTEEVTVIVPDRRTADYICHLLPGSKQNFLDLGIPELGKNMRNTPSKAPAKTATERSKERYEREVQRKSDLEQLGHLIRNIHGVANERDAPIQLSFEENIFSRNIAAETFQTWDEVYRLLENVWSLTIKDKHDNLLMNGGIFRVGDGETVKGLDNFTHSHMLQLDFDDSELDPRELALLLSDIKHVAYNSFNNGRDGLFRYRVVVPLASPVTVEIYQGFWDIIAARVVDAGYSVGKTGRHSGLSSGLDLSKRTPVSWMYLPSQASKKQHSFWLSNWEAPILQPAEWISRMPAETPEYIDAAIVMNHGEKLRALIDALKLHDAGQDDGEKFLRAEARKKNGYERALEAWKATSAGEGNDGFFRFAAQLRSSGHDLADVHRLLNLHYADSASVAGDRKKQIPSIEASLKRRGQFPSRGFERYR